MTMNDLLSRVDNKDYDKVLILCDGIGWTNISGKVDITESAIKIYPDNNVIFSDDK